MKHEEYYYVIHNSDGDTTVKKWTKEKLEKELNDDYWGEDAEFFKEFIEGDETDTNYWGDKILIIKGTLVSPQAVEKITKLEIE